MDNRGKIIDCTEYLQAKTKSRRRRRLAVGGFIALIIGLWLLQFCQCEQNKPNLLQNGVSKLKVSDPPAPPLQSRQILKRQAFSRNSKSLAPWAAELFDALQERKDAVRNCILTQETHSFTWRFSYQPKGTLMHQEIIWSHGKGDDKTEDCLRQVLEQSYRVKKLPLDQNQWFNLDIQFSNGME